MEEEPEDEVDDELDDEPEGDDEEGAAFGSPGKGNLSAAEGAPPGAAAGFTPLESVFGDPELSAGKGNCCAVEGAAAPGTLAAGATAQGSFLVGTQGAVVRGGGGG